MQNNYTEFLEKKIVVAGSFGVEIDQSQINPIALPHQKDIIQWCLKGGRRGIFASFGLGKTLMQLEIARLVIEITGKPFLICMPLGVVGEFRDDNELLNTGFDIKYITDTDSIQVQKAELKAIKANSENDIVALKKATDEYIYALDNQKPIESIIEIGIYVTNYERVRKGDIDPQYFGGVSFDEASILRNLKTETTNFVLKHFKDVHFRFVATATPTPNDFIEILNYADYLGVIDRGHALTRFFQRDSTKAGHLTLYDNKKEEFWKWVSSWAVFINKPSDLGYDDTGYNLPKLNFIEVEIENISTDVIQNKKGDIVLIKDTTKSLIDTSREKSSTIYLRVQKAFDIVQEKGKYSNWILWSHLEAERVAIEKKFKEDDYIDLRSVYGSQTNIEKENLLIDFKHSKYQILNTKPKIAGSGCNFQEHCNNMVFVGIDYKFNDFIQAIHRLYRFKQDKEVNVYAIFTNNEREVLKTLKDKWRKHIELQTEMINLVREYGLNTDKITADMKRKIFENRRSATIGGATVFNDDTVNVHNEMADNSTDMILTSIPFGDHYEYSDNYNDFGHNDGNVEFFKQMDYLTPNLLRTLKPGKIAAIHVKDRIRYSYQNGTSFTSIESFSNDTLRHFTKASIGDKIQMLEDLKKEGIVLTEKLEAELLELKKDYQNRFYHVGTITVTTDVVRENNQNYRLGWSEQCKDATKMGVGLPEYIFLFRKRPSEMNNAYADEPVVKAKNENEVYCNCCKTPIDLTDSDDVFVKENVVYHKKCKGNDFSELEEIYPIDNWQLDAHAYWKSSGNRFLSSKELASTDMKTVFDMWRKHDKEKIYDFQEHLKVCQDLDSVGKLSRLFMTIPPTSPSDMVWTDVNRMNTLNTNQANRKKEKHICPLQIDVVKRLINRFTMPGDLVDDPFGGLFTTPYVALEMNRRAISAELNPDYYDDGLFYLKSIEYKINVPSLFDVLEITP